MREKGKIIEINDNKAKVMIQRNTACGSCGACQIGQDNLNMILLAENCINGKVGDEVEIDLKTSNFLLATGIAYGIPLLSLMLGIMGSYILLPYIGISPDAIQGIAAIMGIVFLAISFLLIRANENKISKLKQFKPEIVSSYNDED